MPALPSPGNIIRIQMLHHLGADLAAGSRIYLAYSGGTPNSAYLANLANQTQTDYGTYLAALLSSAFAMNECIALDLSSSGGAEGLSSSVVNGTRTGTYMTAGQCVVLNFEIVRKYRGGRPRIYMPWGVQGDLATTQAWSTTFTTAINTAWGNFMTALLSYSSGGITLNQHVSVGYYGGFTNYTGSGGRAKVRANVLSTPHVDNVTTHSARQVVGSQRRRLTAP